MMTIDLEKIIKTDQEHFVHPQFHPNDHKQPFVWVSGDGAKLRNADGRNTSTASLACGTSRWDMAVRSLHTPRSGRWSNWLLRLRMSATRTFPRSSLPSGCHNSVIHR